MRDGLRILDSDIHVIEPDSIWTDYLDPAFAHRAPRRPQGETGRVTWLEMEGRVFPAYADTPERQRAIQLRYTSPDALARMRQRDDDDVRELFQGTTAPTMVKAMDREGVDVAVVFRTFAAHVLAVDELDPALAAALCRAFNRWLADFCAHDPDRLKGGAQIPLHDVALAVEEARVAVEDLGHVTLVLPSHQVCGRPLYHPDYEPFWAAAEDHGVAVSVHGIQSAYCAGTLSSRYHDNHVMGHAVGQPVELMLSLGAVLTGGVAARHPGLRFAFLEGNCSWLPWWLYALDERWKAWGDREGFGQDELPSELFRRQCFVSVDADEALVSTVVEHVGDDNLVFSTDWPHDDSAYPGAVDELLGLPLSGESQRKVLWDNCARLYGLE